MTSIALIGLMGSGKSTVGAVVAARTGLPLVDVDRVIIARTGRTVRELWAEGGEAAYRALESEVAIEALDGPHDVVLAVPGGAILDPEVRAALAGASVVWLRTDPSVLGTRVRADDHRPLLGADPAADLAEMAKARDAIYAAEADLVIDTDDLEPSVIADRILEWLHAESPRRDRS